MVPPRPVAFGDWSNTPSITSTPRMSWATAKPTFTQRNLLAARRRSIPRPPPMARRGEFATYTVLCILRPVSGARSSLVAGLLGAGLAGCAAVPGGFGRGSPPTQLPLLPPAPAVAVGPDTVAV